MKKVILVVIGIFSFNSMIADDSRLLKAAQQAHRISEQCPTIDLQKVDKIVDNFIRRAGIFTNKEMRLIFTSSGENNLVPFQKAEALGFILESNSCKYIAQRFKVITDTSVALTEIGKGDCLTKDMTEEDFKLAEEYLEKMKEEDND